MSDQEGWEEALRQRDAAWNRVRDLEAALRESDEYLSGNPFNSIGAGSKLHRDMRRAWQDSESEREAK